MWRTDRLSDRLEQAWPCLQSSPKLSSRKKRRQEWKAGFFNSQSFPDFIISQKNYAGSKNWNKKSIEIFDWMPSLTKSRKNEWEKNKQVRGSIIRQVFGGHHHPLTTNFFSVCFLSLWLQLFQILSNNCSKFFHKKCSIKFLDLIEPLKEAFL